MRGIKPFLWYILQQKRREKMLTQHDKDDEFLKPIIKQAFFDSKKRFGRKPIQYKLKEMGYQVSEKRACD